MQFHCSKGRHSKSTKQQHAALAEYWCSKCNAALIEQYNHMQTL
jgi:hypothetical protein